MESNQLESVVTSLEQKVLLLGHRCAELQTQVEALRKENQELNLEQTQLKQKVKNFQNQPKLPSIAQHLTSDPASAQALIAKLDEYVREIDRCIAFLKE